MMDESFRKILYKIKSDFGLEIFENSKRVNSILLDLAPEMKKERIQMINIINAGGYRELKEGNVACDIIRNRLEVALENEYGIRQEIANWIVGVFIELFHGDLQVTNTNYNELKAVKTIYHNRIAAGKNHTIALNCDGTVFAVGDNTYGQCNVKGFKDIASVYAKDDTTFLLTNEKELIIIGRLKQDVKKNTKIKKVYLDEFAYGITEEEKIVVPDELAGVGTKYKFEHFTDLKEIAIGAYHYIGLKNTGKVVATGLNEKGQIKVHTWRNIVSVASGFWFSVGLANDGTVVACGSNLRGQCEVQSWRNISSIYAAGNRTIGLRRDGTVVATGNNEYGQCNVENWRNIVAVFLNDDVTIGLTVDGQVYATGRNDYNQCNTRKFINVVALAVGENHTVGLSNDGTMVETGANECGQCEVENIKIKI